MSHLRGGATVLTTNHAPIFRDTIGCLVLCEAISHLIGIQLTVKHIDEIHRHVLSLCPIKLTYKDRPSSSSILAMAIINSGPEIRWYRNSWLSPIISHARQCHLSPFVRQMMFRVLRQLPVKRSDSQRRWFY